VAIGSIGNKPIYQFEASNLKEEGTSLSDWTVVYKSSNENVVRLVPNTDPKKVNLQIVDKGSSIVSVDYFDALGTKVIHISKHWNLDDSDLLDASVFTNKILDSNNFGTENMGMYHIVRKTDTALISILDINGIGTTWDTPFVQNWNIGFESNNTNANIVTSQWLTKHEIGFNCSSFTAGMWVWLNATTPGGIKYVLTDADVNAPNDGGWQVYDS
jgi:hypothetical protein